MCSTLDVAAVPGVSLAVLQAAVVQNQAAMSRLAAREAVLLDALDTRSGGLVPDGDGASMPIMPWLRDATGMAVGKARRAVEVARGLAALPAVREACVSGELRMDRAEVLALELVPHIPVEALALAEGPLLEAARLCEPTALRARIRAWVADNLPETFADDEASVKPWLQFDTAGPGQWRLHGLFDAAGTEVLKTALLAISAKNAVDDPRCGSQRRADGLVALAQQALDSGTLPITGGVKPQVTIVVDAAVMFGGSGPAARADHVGPLARPHLLALTCDAELLLARISRDGTLVSLHSGARVVTGGLRRAVNARDRGCVHTGCSTPAAACHAHHVQHWADGGTTSINNLVLLCPRHHAGWHRGTVSRRNLRLPGDPEPPQQQSGENGAHYFARLLETPMPGDARPLRVRAGTAV